MPLEALAKATLAIPSFTTWTRLEPLPRDASMERSLQAQVRDAAWMLARQWQVGEFLGDGSGIALDGALPINTSGGQLSGGRLHGMGFLHEACVQLWGEGGDRQAPRTPEVVAVGVGGGPVAGSMLLSGR